MYQHKIPVRDLAKGRWSGILLQFGVPSHYLNGKHQDCPLCQDGKDRFRFDDKEMGRYYCNSCGAGDGFMFAEKYTGMSFKEISTKIESICGMIEPTKQKPKISSKSATDLIKRIWRESKDISKGDEAWTYLRNRGLNLEITPKSMRLHSGLEYKDGNEVLGKYPAIVSLIASKDGKAITIHRTYIKDGYKAPVPKPKKMMPVGEGVTVNGGSIRMFESGEILGLSEGIETGLAASELFQIPVWSCVSANGLETFEIPEGSQIKKIIIFSDNDGSFAGQKSAYTLANRLYIKNKEISIEVLMPTVIGDWLDEFIRIKNLTK